MAVQTITYDNKVALNVNPDIADVNKVTDNDMNEIKSVVNNNANNIGDLSNLTTPTTTNLVGAINSIVESGSNTNGTYIKYADGTMICTKIINAVTSITNTWGSLYESGDVDLGDFPETFISKPIISVTNASDVGAGAMIEAVFGVSTTSAGQCWLCRGTPRASTVPYMLNIIAIGKWK